MHWTDHPHATVDWTVPILRDGKEISEFNARITAYMTETGIEIAEVEIEAIDLSRALKDRVVWDALECPYGLTQNDKDRSFDARLWDCVDSAIDNDPGLAEEITEKCAEFERDQREEAA